jgi:hypothetical protein
MEGQFGASGRPSHADNIRRCTASPTQFPPSTCARWPRSTSETPDTRAAQRCASLHGPAAHCPGTPGPGSPASLRPAGRVWAALQLAGPALLGRSTWPPSQHGRPPSSSRPRPSLPGPLGGLLGTLRRNTRPSAPSPLCGPLGASGRLVGPRQVKPPAADPRRSAWPRRRWHGPPWAPVLARVSALGGPIFRLLFRLLFRYSGAIRGLFFRY